MVRDHPQQHSTRTTKHNRINLHPHIDPRSHQISMCCVHSSFLMPTLRHHCLLLSDLRLFHQSRRHHNIRPFVGMCADHTEVPPAGDGLGKAASNAIDQCTKPSNMSRHRCEGNILLVYPPEGGSARGINKCVDSWLTCPARRDCCYPMKTPPLHV